MSGWTRPPVISTVSPSSILHARLHKCIICLSNVIMMPIIPSCLLQIKSFHNGSIVGQQIVGSLDNLRGSLSPVSAEDYDITIGGVLPSRGQSSVFQKGVGLQPNWKIKIFTTRLYKVEKIIQGVPQLSSHFVSVILSPSTHPNCKSWGSFEKFRKFATR